MVLIQNSLHMAAIQILLRYSKVLFLKKSRETALRKIQDLCLPLPEKKPKRKSELLTELPHMVNIQHCLLTHDI